MSRASDCNNYCPYSDKGRAAISLYQTFVGHVCGYMAYRFVQHVNCVSRTTNAASISDQSIGTGKSHHRVTLYSADSETILSPLLP